MITKLNLSIAALCLIGMTVVYAQKERLLPILQNIGISAPTPTMAKSTPPPLATQTTTPTNVAKQLTNITDLSAMLQAFDRILGLNEEQKDEITHQNEKAVERLSMARSEQRSPKNLQRAEQNIIQLRDEMVGKILNPAQLKKWQTFIENKNTVDNLQELRTAYEKYRNRSVPFTKSEGNEFQTLEAMQTYIQKATDEIRSIGISETELQQFAQLLYNF